MPEVAPHLQVLPHPASAASEANSQSNAVTKHHITLLGGKAVLHSHSRKLKVATELYSYLGSRTEWGRLASPPPPVKHLSNLYPLPPSGPPLLVGPAPSLSAMEFTNPQGPNWNLLSFSLFLGFRGRVCVCVRINSDGEGAL